MIFLFNSAFRPLYLKNVLNTIFLPSGITNEYRYKCRGNNANVDSEIIRILEKSNIEKDALIIFIDRYAKNGYRFIPLRKAYLKGTKVDQDRLFITTALQDFIFPSDLSEFNDSIKKALGEKGLPHLIDDDPSKTNDGCYVIISESFLSENNQLIRGDEAWIKIVDDLMQVKAFSHSDSDPIFIKASINNMSKNRSDRINLIAGKRYSLELSYRYPKQKRNTTSTQIINIMKSDNIDILNNQPIQIDSFVNKINREFIPRGYPKDRQGSLSLQEQKGILIPSANIPLLISEGTSITLKRILLLTLFFLSSVLIGIDLKQHQDILTIIFKEWPKLLAAGLQAVILFCAFKWFGDKIF